MGAHGARCVLSLVLLNISLETVITELGSVRVSGISSRVKLISTPRPAPLPTYGIYR